MGLTLKTKPTVIFGTKMAKRAVWPNLNGVKKYNRYIDRKPASQNTTKHRGEQMKYFEYGSLITADDERFHKMVRDREPMSR